MFPLGLASKVKPLRNLAVHVCLEWRLTALTSLVSLLYHGDLKQKFERMNRLVIPYMKTFTETQIRSFLPFFFLSTFLFPLLSLSLLPLLSFCLCFLKLYLTFSSMLCFTAYLTGYRKSYQTTTHLQVCCFSKHHSKTVFLS